MVGPTPADPLATSCRSRRHVVPLVRPLDPIFVGHTAWYAYGVGRTGEIPPFARLVIVNHRQAWTWETKEAPKW